MKKKSKMPSQSALKKLHRNHAKTTIPELVRRVEKTQVKIAHLQKKNDHQIGTLLYLIGTLEENL
jgi:hypothetical protein